MKDRDASLTLVVPLLHYFRSSTQGSEWAYRYSLYSFLRYGMFINSVQCASCGFSSRYRMQNTNFIGLSSVLNAKSPQIVQLQFPLLFFTCTYVYYRICATGYPWSLHTVKRGFLVLSNFNRYSPMRGTRIVVYDTWNTKPVEFS